MFIGVSGWWYSPSWWYKLSWQWLLPECVLMAGLGAMIALMHHRCAAPPSQSPISLTQARWGCKPATNNTLSTYRYEGRSVNESVRHLKGNVSAKQKRTCWQSPTTEVSRGSPESLFCIDKLRDVDPWSCYMCTPSTCSGKLKLRSDWSLKVQEFFVTNSAMVFVSDTRC